MAYFACSKAALTGTDKATRLSIAKGLVSPYTKSGTLRGVVQLDQITGNDLGYITHKSLENRLRSLGAQSRVSKSQSTQQTQNAELHASPSEVIQTSKTFAFPIKTVVIGLGAVIGLYLVLK